MAAHCLTHKKRADFSIPCFPDGGDRLARAPADYPVGEILRAAEGELAPVACLAREGHKCDRVGFCYTLPFWKGLEDQINAYVNSFSLQDLLDLKDQEKENGCCVCGGKEDETR